MAVDRNVNIKSANFEKEKAESFVSESYSHFYPKISIGASLQDNIKLPTVMLPGDIFQQPGLIPIQMGTKFNTNAAASFNMILYNKTALSALQLSKKASEISDLGIEKVREELAYEVSKLYFMTLTTSEQKIILENNITKTKRLRDITKVLVDNGMALQVDYDRVNVSIENLMTQLNNVDAGLEQQLNTLKYILNIPISDSIILTDKTELTLLEKSPMNEADFSNHIDIKLLESQKEINLLNKKVVNSGYYPSLLISGQYAFTGQRREFKNYFNDSPENLWHQSSMIGLSLSIPIFDGFEKKAKSNQAELDYLKTDILLADKKENLNVNYRVAINNYNISKNNLERQKQNIELATKVYDETTLKYGEGMASMSNLLQDEMSLSSAQANYLNALYSFKESELKIMSLNGEIKKLIKE
jgi:outer membrane protein TolC